MSERIQTQEDKTTDLTEQNNDDHRFYLTNEEAGGLLEQLEETMRKNGLSHNNKNDWNEIERLQKKLLNDKLKKIGWW